jgi:hypothetical protein
MSSDRYIFKVDDQDKRTQAWNSWKTNCATPYPSKARAAPAYAST